MRVLRGLEALPDPERGAGRVATVGVFDGVHLGHFTVMREVAQRAQGAGLGSAVVTFSGHPKGVLTGRAPSTVTSLEHRLLLFERIGIGTTLVLEFTPELRELSAEQFFLHILVDGLGTRELVLGFDSKFGKDRGGTIESLRSVAAGHEVALHEVPPLRLGGRAVSSTAVREAVSLGELERAAAMLGRPVSLLGTVVEGDRRGRTLGFPTANLDLHHELRPPEGVYAAKVLIDGRGELLDAVVNVGHRPTFDGEGISVEAHLLDFDADLYGRDLEIFFLAFLRGERSFDGPDALREQITADAARAREVLGNAAEAWRIPGDYLPIEGTGPEALESAPHSRPR